MTAPKPKPQECWGLYDASGKLWAVHETYGGADIQKFREDKRRPQPSGHPAFTSGWTIRRVTVTPSDKNGGEG